MRVAAAFSVFDRLLRPDRRADGSRSAGSHAGGTVDAADVARFTAVADAWWDETGPFAPLHRMTPARMRVIRERAIRAFGRSNNDPRPLDGLAVLDVGCGGGLLAEPMARLGGRVTGIDASDAGIDAAIGHARVSGLDIDYRVTSIEDLAETAPAAFDLVVASEVIEHVADPVAFTGAIAALLKPGGLTVLTTINRTPASFALAKVAAEYVLGWVPRGTHDWRQFITPGELDGLLFRAGLEPEEPVGIAYRPMSGDFALSRDDSVNYALSARKPQTA